MTRRSRRNHSPALNAKVALASLNGGETLAQLAKRFDLHANQIMQWRTQLLEGAAELFCAGSRRMRKVMPRTAIRPGEQGQFTDRVDLNRLRDAAERRTWQDPTRVRCRRSRTRLLGPCPAT